MNILFVSPNWTDALGVFSNIAKKRNSQAPLGILYLASVAERNGHTVRVIDADVEGFTLNEIVEEILDNHYDLVGLTATSPIFHKAVYLAKELKKEKYDGSILIGGEHLNIFKKEAFFDCFDYGFYGESDRNFEQFLSIMEKKKHDFSDMSGFIYRENGHTVETKASDRIHNLDSLDFPAMHLLDSEKYVVSFAKFKSRPFIPLLATRGCPFKCVYCSEPLTNPNIRFRSPENVVDEIEKWSSELNVHHFFFMDSNLTLKMDQIKGICDEIIRRKLKITFEGWTRANLVDREILALMKKAGLIRISYGLESGDPKILKIIRKEVSHRDMLRAFRLTKELGIEPACSVMLGLPGETKASVRRTIDFVRKIPEILYANFSICNPYPGTEVYKWALTGKHGIRLQISDFSEYRRYDHSPITVNDLTQQDLVWFQKLGLFKIHMKPKRIIAAIKMIGLPTLLVFGLQFLSGLILPNREKDNI